MSLAESSATIWNVSLAVALILVVKFALDKGLAVKQALKNISQYPGGQIIMLNPFRSLALVLGPIFPGNTRLGNFYAKFSIYEQYGCSILSSVTLWSATTIFWVADAESIKVVASAPNTFQKDVKAYELINIYGGNLIGTEGADWRRHRAVAKPAFNEANVALVWDETCRVLNDWFTHIEQLQKSTKGTLPTVDLVSDMEQATLQVISAAGFGIRTAWSSKAHSSPPQGRTLSFHSAIHFALTNLFFKMLTPNWASVLLSRIPVPYLTARIKETSLAFDELRMYMLDIIASARDTITNGDGNSVGEAAPALLRNLVEANMAQEGPKNRRLTDDELLSDVFVFLLAGHETSAHSLSFVITLLALYPDVQSKVYEEVLRLWPAGAPAVIQSTTSYSDDFPKLVYTTAVFREALRLFTPILRLAKHAHADTTLTGRQFTPHLHGRNKHGDIRTIQIAVPKGSVVMFDISGLHMNPIYWGEDAEKFKPERFIDTEVYRWPRDAYIPFSAGARGCIGSRFAMAQSMCIIASLVRHYEILLPLSMEGKLREEQEHSMLKWTTGVTIKPLNAKVRLKVRL